MPYYRNTILGETRPSSAGATYPSQPGTLVMDAVTMVSYRDRPPKGYYEPVSDQTADPYASFLEVMNRGKWKRALEARGYTAPDLPTDEGHTFDLQRWRLTGNPQSYSEWNKGYPYQMYGSRQNILWLRAPDGGAAGWDSSVWTSDLANYAQSAWTKVAPTSEVFDLANFAGELREKLPTILPEAVRSKTQFFKSLGDGYLNVEFGWLPFIDGLRDAAYALLRAQNQLSFVAGPLHRKHGRKITLPSEVSTYSSVTTYYGYHPTAVRPAMQAIGMPVATAGGGPAHTMSVRASRTRSRDQWFEGQFVGLPKIGYDPNSYLSRLDQLINVQLTPAVLWELAPWSWLVDWGLRVGDSLQANVLANDDRIHAQYAYAMEHTREKQFISATASTIDTSTRRFEGWSNQYLTLYRERKQRIRANPFGFTLGGLTALTESQFAILAALGLTKARR